MSNNVKCDIHDLLDLFSETLEPSDVLSSKLMSQISSNITKERIKMRMNQKEFAAYLGVTQSEISRWEHGNYNFSIKKAAEIAVKLGMDMDIHFTKISEKKNNANYALLSTPSAITVVYSSSDQTSYRNKQVRKLGAEVYKHASICK